MQKETHLTKNKWIIEIQSIITILLTIPVCVHKFIIQSPKSEIDATIC